MGVNYDEETLANGLMGLILKTNSFGLMSEIALSNSSS
jgi:hypothetical protein